MSFLQVLDTVSSAANYALLVPTAVTVIMQIRAVKGTYQAYVWATAAVVSLAMYSLSFVALAVVYTLVDQWYAVAVLDLLLAAVYARWAWQIANSNDNWFNRTGKRMKRWLRKLRQVRLRLPVLSPQPSAG